MRLRFRPVDTTFYDLFTEAAQHLVGGAELLAEMLADGTDKQRRRGPDAGRRARGRRDHPRADPAGQHARS